MEVLYILVPMTLVMAGVFVFLFVASASRGQFEELESPANRALFEDQRLPASEAALKKNKSADSATDKNDKQE